MRTGRPIRTLDWIEIEKLVGYQCTQEEICAFFDVNHETLNADCLRVKGMSFSQFRGQKLPTGRLKLKKIQMALAEQGSAAMAIFLGKHLLGQTDKPFDQDLLDTAQAAGMTREQLMEIVRNASKLAVEQNKKTFEEFCLAGEYPTPYPKQVEMMRFGMMGLDPRLLLGSRGYGKTDYVVICGLGYLTYLDPINFSGLLMTKSKERNAAILAEIHAVCVKNGVMFEKVNSTHLRARGLHGKDHSISSVTIKTTSLRGRHPKIVVMDDPVTEDDTSDATRLIAEKKYNELMKLTKNILLIGQPAHKYDLYAKVRNKIATMEVPFGTIPELDHDLDAQRAAQVDEASIQASYFLKILPEGATPFDNVKYMAKFPETESAVAWIDPSHEGGDFTALTILTAYMQGVAVVGFLFKKAWNHALNDMVPLIVKYKVKRLAFETNALGDQPIIMLGQLLKNTGIGVTGRKSTLNKHSKIMAAGSYAHLIHLAKESHSKYIDQVVQYEYKAKFDDAPDSLASCLEWIGLIRGKT